MADIILGIESSCDETSAAVLVDGEIKSNIITTQQVHEAYGGVVPELASRAHQQNIVPAVQEALNQAGISKYDLSGIAFTRGPGLLGALLVGTSFAKGLSLSTGAPLIEVNHMQAHILAHFIEKPCPSFPFICLTVSGGHTQLVLVRNHLDMEVIGQTQDDAVGEAFDKTAKLLGFAYPGGPHIDKHAQKGNPLAFKFPEVSAPELNFSFSGIKTSFLYFLQNKAQKDSAFIRENLDDICASIQYTLIQILMNKLKEAAARFNVKHIAIAGGVSANSGLRKAIEGAGNELGWDTFIPDFEYCTDNAAMIAMAGYYKYLAKEFVDQSVVPNPRLKF